MKIISKLIILIAISSIIVACGDDDSPSIDQRLTYAGTYELEDFDVSAVISDEDTVITIDDGIEIELELSANPNEIEFEVTDLVGLVLKGTLGAGFAVTFEDDLIMNIEDYGEFDLESEFSFNAGSEIINGDFTMEGEIVEDKITFDFEFSFDSSSTIYNFEGEAEGEKE